MGTADQKTSIVGTSISADDISIGIRSSYILSDHFAAELSYQDFGEARTSQVTSSVGSFTDTLETTTTSLGFKGSLPFDNSFSLTARLGVALWDYTLEETFPLSPGESLKIKDDGKDFYYGIGIQYNITENVFAEFEYTVLDMDTNLMFLTAANVAVAIPAENEVENIALSISRKF